MRRLIRSNPDDWAPRIEMTPLLDVVFLLLTFFIFSLVLMVQANVLPVTLPKLSAAQPSKDPKIAGITIDADNRIHLNRKPVSDDELRSRLLEFSKQTPPPAVYVALEAEGAGVDRGPTLVRMIDLLRSSGIENFYVVGESVDEPTSQPEPKQPR